MQNNKFLYRTKLGINQYTYSALRSLIVLVPSVLLLAVIRNFEILFYCVLLLSFFLTMFLFFRTLKTFHLYSEKLIVRRFFLKSEVFAVQKIQKILFYDIGSEKNKSSVMRIVSIDSENEFALIYFGEDLKAFIKSLKQLGIETENNLRSIDYYR